MLIALSQVIYSNKISFLFLKPMMNYLLFAQVVLTLIVWMHNWLALEVVGPLGFSLTGIMANISGVLARASISIFALSTYDTDYVLVKKQRINDAIKTLKKDGYTVLEEPI